jgi:DnaK suppressor protein
MNASVTKSAKKTSVASFAKTSVAPKTSAAAVGKSKVTSMSSGIKNALKSASKTGSVEKTAPTTRKAAAKIDGNTVKPAAKTVSKTAAKPTAKAIDAKKSAPAKTVANISTKKTGTTEKTTTKASAASIAARTPVAATPVAATQASTADSANADADIRATKADTPMSVSKATQKIVDNIQEPVVSKVTEVATKTTKSTPAAPHDSTLLTEEQILQMGEKDYMNEAQLAFFKARLQALEKELLKNAGETTEHLRETVLVPDPADRATIEEEHALELRTRDRERKLLKKVQQSLAAIESGEYGWCEETGEPIGIPRLLARPTATLSLEAQQRRELKQKLYGD